MNVEHVNLTEDGRVYFDVYLQVTAWELPNSQKRPLVLVCPGGGYQMTSEREADPIAMAFMAEGFHTAVLRYSVGQYAQFPNSLTDLSKTMKYIRAHAAQWHIDPERIAVAAFRQAAIWRPHWAFIGMTRRLRSKPDACREKINQML